MKNNIFKISNPDKILFPKDGITKSQLIDYYEEMATAILPFMKNHIVTLLRYPNGIHQEGFYQKDVSAFPDWIEKKRIKNKDGSVTYYPLCNKPEDLSYLANLACITPHIWLSSIQKITYPNWLVIDLDPYSAKDFELVRDTAFTVKEFFQELSLKTFPLLTGSRGAHVYVPLKAADSFTMVRKFARDACEILARRSSKFLTIEARKEKRGKRLLLDYLRNSYGATVACPFSVRAKDGAPIVTPISWSELADKNITSQTFTMKDGPGRAKLLSQVWPNFFSIKQQLR